METVEALSLVGSYPGTKQELIGIQISRLREEISTPQKIVWSFDLTIWTDLAGRPLSRGMIFQAIT